MNSKLIITLVAISCLIVGDIECRPKDESRDERSPKGYTVQCQDEETAPGVWSYTCHPPNDDRITLDLEHVVQFQRSDLADQTPKVLNIVVPNYKIQQVIQPEILTGNSDTPSLTVNILLEKPKVLSERKATKDDAKEGRSDDTISRPVVNIQYRPNEEIVEKGGEHTDEHPVIAS